MRETLTPSRRTFGRLLAGWAASLAGPARAEDERPRDRGIGGTGAAPDMGDGDRGIGGTGVVGTIRRFGSIYVNGLRIAYPADVAVTIDGVPARAADLRVGQVVRTVAEGRDAALATRRIDVASEVVGRIETAAPGMLTVLGQRVATDALPGGASWGLGERVAVYGQRRPDGTVVASLIEPRDGGPVRVAGPVTAADGVASIGGLRLRDVDPALVGQRAVLTGTLTGDGLRVESGAAERASFGPAVRRLSIEGYVERGPDGLRLGSGLRLLGAGPRGPVRDGLAVVTSSLDRQGRAVVDRVRAAPSGGPTGSRPGAGPGESGAGSGGRGPGGGGAGNRGEGGPGRRGGGAAGAGRPGAGASGAGGPGAGGLGAGPGERPDGGIGRRTGPFDGPGPGGADPFGSRPDGFGRSGGGGGGFGGPPGRR